MSYPGSTPKQTVHPWPEVFWTDRRLGLHRASGGVWEYLGGAPGTGDSLGILQFEEPGGGEVRIAVVKEGLSCIGRTGTGQEQQGDQRPTDPPGAPGQGTQKPLPILPDTQPGEGPNPRQAASQVRRI